MPYCPYCGQSLDDPSGRYCPSCGREHGYPWGQIQASSDNREPTPKRPSNLKKYAVIAAACTAIGYLILFLPVLSLNGQLLLPGLILALCGEFSLLGITILAMYRSMRLARMRAKSVLVYKRSLMPTLFGGLALWLSELPTYLIPQKFGFFGRVFSLDSLESTLVGSFVFALFVSWYYIYYYDRIPTKNPISKSLIVSFTGLGLIAILGTLASPDRSLSYFLELLLRDIPSYLVLGYLVGYSYKRFTQGELAIPITQVEPMKRRTTVYYALVIIVIIVLIGAAGYYINPMQFQPTPPASPVYPWYCGGTNSTTTSTRNVGGSIPIAGYEEQVLLDFAQNSTSFSANVTGSEQNDTFGYGPNYLLTGATDKDYWYQIGFGWNQAYVGGGHEVGFHFTYGVYDPNGTQISSNDAANPQTTAFLGSANDIVLLKLALAGPNVTMYARDLNDNASFVSSYANFGATHFTRSYENSQSILFTSGLSISWFHANPYQCSRSSVSFTWLPNSVQESQICVEEWNFTSSYLLTNETGYGFPTECTTSPAMRYADVNASIQGNSFVVD